jgi:hypothetical protein
MFAEGPGGEGEVGHVPGEVEPAVAAVVVSPHPVENLFCCNGIGLETQYALQRRHDAAIRIAPSAVQVMANFLAATGTSSLLDHDEHAWLRAWKQRFPARARISNGDSGRALLIYAHRKVEELHLGRGWDVEYPRDIWRLRNLEVTEGPATVRFDQITASAPRPTPLHSSTSNVSRTAGISPRWAALCSAWRMCTSPATTTSPDPPKW